MSEIKRVKVAEPFLAELDRKWSRPVEVMIAGTDGDGDLELTFRTVPDYKALLEEALEAMEAVEVQVPEGGVGFSPPALQSLRETASRIRSHLRRTET